MKSARIGLAVLLMTVPVAADDFGVFAQFRAWIVACDNMRACRLYGFADGTTMSGLAMRIDRAAEREASPVIALEGEDPIAGTGALIIEADRRQIARVESGPGLIVSGQRVVIGDSAAQTAILGALRRAQTLSVRWSTQTNALGTISLDGASAALLFADDRQRRVGTVTALVNPGSRPASTIPEAPTPLSAPALSAPMRDPPRIVPRGLEEVFAREAACEETNRTLTSTDIEIYRLGDRAFLVGVRCWRAAYNTATVWYVAREGGAVERAPVVAPFTVRDGASAGAGDLAAQPHVLTNSEFRATNRTLTHFYKGRGAGDCGMSATWHWDGMRFRPVTATFMPACRGIASNDWMTLYRGTDQP